MSFKFLHCLFSNKMPAPPADPPPIYKELGRTYVADQCGPLARAAASGQISLQAWTSGHYPGRRLHLRTLPGLRTLGYWDALQPQDWGLDWHRNEGIELTMLETGRLGFSVDSQEVTLGPGDLTITRPWQSHRVGAPCVAPGRLHWLILDVGVRRPHQAWHWPPWLVLSKADLGQLTDLLRHHEQPVWHATEDIQAIFRRVAPLIESAPTAGSVSWISLLLNELFLRLLDVVRRTGQPRDDSLSSSLRTVELFLGDLCANRQHLAAEWTLTRMAAACGLGVTRFVHHCKQLTNATPVQYLNACRVQAARELLTADPARSVTDIARSCGFSSSQYFATFFTRNCGCSPREYRRLVTRRS